VSELPPPTGSRECDAFSECKPPLIVTESLSAFTIAFFAQHADRIAAFDRKPVEGLEQIGISSCNPRSPDSGGFCGPGSYSFPAELCAALRGSHRFDGFNFLVERHLLIGHRHCTVEYEESALLFLFASHRIAARFRKHSRAAEDGEFDYTPPRRGNQVYLQTGAHRGFGRADPGSTGASCKARIACKHSGRVNRPGRTGHPHRDAHVSQRQTLQDSAALAAVDAN